MDTSTQVQGAMGGWALSDFTWEPLHVINDPKALDHYLELEGVTCMMWVLEMVC